MNLSNIDTYTEDLKDKEIQRLLEIIARKDRLIAKQNETISTYQTLVNKYQFGK